MRTRQRESLVRRKGSRFLSIFSCVHLFDLKIRLLGFRGLCVVAKNAAFVISVVELGAVWADAPATPEKEFCCEQRSDSWREEIDPKRVPVATAEGRDESSRRMHA